MENVSVPRMLCEELQQMIEKDEKVVIIDTRATASYKDDHIKGAINIYLNPGGDPFERQMTYMALPADKALIIYCDCVDESDSLIVAREIKDARYDINDIKVLELGINRWKDLGYPTEKSEF
ncbi:MAG TPA: rhodanese-like domain-containing protein [Dehalococcoidia bacterium]|nr:rhodanese-like domain-containing protein [Dehalococcoidia bacterium]